MKKITLINGPLNGTRIKDLGTVQIQMPLREGQEAGARIGTSIYEPNEDRSLAFFLENQWHGKLVSLSTFTL